MIHADEYADEIVTIRHWECWPEWWSESDHVDRTTKTVKRMMSIDVENSIEIKAEKWSSNAKEY